MSKHQAFVRTLLFASLAAALGCPTTLAATKTAARKSPNQNSEAVFRCRDEKGHFIMGQSIPAECMEADVDVLDKTGRVIRTIPGRRSQEQLNQQKADADALQAAAQRDRTLLATYLSVADIERLRDSRLEQLDQQVRVTRQYITNLRARETRLMQDVQRYRPYSPKSNAPVLPEALAAEIVNTVNGLKVYEQEQLKNTGDQQQLRAEFEADITRFKELKASVQR